MTFRTARACLAVAAVTAAAVVWQVDPAEGGGEFTGGSLAGPLYRMSEAAFLPFVLAAVAVWRWPRAAGLTAAIASILAYPLAAYSVAPGLFRSMGGAFHGPLPSYFVWDAWPIAGLVAFGTTAVIGVRLAR